MAFQVGAACYPSAMQAAQASASAQVGSVVVHGGTAYVIDVAGAADASITYQFQPLAGGQPLQMVSAYTAQPCNMLQLEDGLQMGWLVAAAWVGVYALLFIGRAIKGDTQDGDS